MMTSDLDRERAARMRRNEEMLATIGVTKALTEVLHHREGGGDGPRASRQAPSSKRGRVKAVEPIRKSQRLVVAGTAQHAEEGEPEEPATTSGRGVGMTQEQYLASKGLPLPAGHFRTDGCFLGWVQKDVAARHGICSSAAEAWEQGGGGSFSRKIRKADVPTELKAKGWSDARAFAAGQLRKNPNAFFYRHTAPGEEQAQGAWTDAEHELFVATARQHGVGDKWGLFASYIPNRVGYQCSAYYKQFIIPSGLILDARFRLDAWGDAIFSGPK
ncbi:hypothetical protein TSOC_009254 [Tetrabaena socialis]|uniref:Uncharacterized protein n=1 Tax=Tetrabaena socialis TaxID=47790 RepID=A0A2J7ZW96_9CHLO|nr:hypothetical protein TSOC_009254 [Tetrabaena socialis]|eukprot:PNH04561.1 hypothetical protein TSOC_009254 [Tetrabaena socialis]